MQFVGFTLPNQLFVAPMAGVTDRPFRQLCKSLGAGMAVSEMVTSNSLLYGSSKTIRRTNHQGEVEPISVQIAGYDPSMMAQAAIYNVEHGAQIIDINMGCPAKKICNVMAGSALMQDPKQVQLILTAVVNAVPNTPVTLKIRTGWDRLNKNALEIAKIAEQCGVKALAIHGRTRSDQYQGCAEYDTIASVKQAVSIPIIANGDIDSPQKAKYVLDYTQADGLMIGRSAQGRPWIFREITHYLTTGQLLPSPSLDEIQEICYQHIQELYTFYGLDTGVKMARKHLSWYTKGLVGSSAFRFKMNRLDKKEDQLASLQDFFNQIKLNSLTPYLPPQIEECRL